MPEANGEHCDSCASDGQECILLVVWLKGSCLEYSQDQELYIFKGRVFMLQFPKESHDEGSSKQWKTSRSSLTREVLVVDALGELTEEVIRLHEVVAQQSLLISLRLVKEGKEALCQEWVF